MIEPETGAAELLQDRGDLGVVDEVAVGFVPVQRVLVVLEAFLETGGRNISEIFPEIGLRRGLLALARASRPSRGACCRWRPAGRERRGP